MNRTTLFLTITGVLLAVVLLFSFFLSYKEPKGFVVTATFYPLAYVAQEVGGEYITVFTITPPGAEAHHYEPTPRDISRITRSHLFLMNGGGLDPWADRLLSSLQESGIPVVVMADRFTTQDPHFWIDPLFMKEYVEAVRDQLVLLDSKNKIYYQENAQKLLLALNNLHKEYVIGLSTCSKRDAIVMHEAFGYIEARYGLVFHSLAGISPEAEPSPRRIADLADLAREHNISIIFFETQVSPRVATTIAKEVGAETRLLHPIESLSKQEKAEGHSYISLMQKNLQELRKALECE
ncbi:MAG: metal ABC transporter substrate-binding protein [bacterium]|nr:metal ABC transporter substrate-binding protein [bacterium]